MVKYGHPKTPTMSMIRNDHSQRPQKDTWYHEVETTVHKQKRSYIKMTAIKVKQYDTT